MAQEYSSTAALRSPPHLTLHMPFNCSINKAVTLDSILRDFSQKREMVKIQLQGFGSFPPKVIFINVLSTEQLDNLQKDLAMAMRTQMNIYNANFKDKPFNPHVTIAFRDLNKSAFNSAWHQVKDLKFDEDPVINELTLLKHDRQQWLPENSYKFNVKSS